VIKKYTEEQIANAVTKCVETWDREQIIRYSTEMLHKEYMDRSRPIGDIDDLITEFGDG
jgi:hypothetical protein